MPVQNQSHCPLGAWEQAPTRRLGGCFSHCGLDQHGGGLQWVVAAPPRLPEDAPLTLLPLPRDGAEVLAIKIRVAAGTKPPATCQGQRKGNMVRQGPWASTGARIRMKLGIGLYMLQMGGCWQRLSRLCSEEPQILTEQPRGLWALQPRNHSCHIWDCDNLLLCTWHMATIH